MQSRNKYSSQTEKASQATKKPIGAPQPQEQLTHLRVPTLKTSFTKDLRRSSLVRFYKKTMNPNQAYSYKPALPPVSQVNTARPASASSARMRKNKDGVIVPKYKVIFLGDCGVGKTCVLQRFMYDSFQARTQGTIGIDFLSKTMKLDNRTIRLQLWDTAGTERFRSLIPSYIRDSDAAVVCYDVGREESFLNTRRWIEDARAERGDDILIFLVGNKSDIGNSERVVSTVDGEELAHEVGAVFCEVSAKAGFNIKALFKKLADSLPDPELPLSMMMTSNRSHDSGSTNSDSLVASYPVKLSSARAPNNFCGC